MTTIYKYPIPEQVNEIELPLAAQILKADYDPTGQLCIWASVDTEVPTAPVKIWKVGTGWPLDAMLKRYNLSFINTINEGPFVWHIFLLKEKTASFFTKQEAQL